VLGRIFTYFALVFGGLALWLALLAPDIVRLIAPPEFFEGHKVIPLILLANLLYAAFYLVSLSFDLSGKTQYPVFIVMLGGIANLGLNLVLIPPLGMMGAAVATLLSFMLLVGIGYPIAQRAYRVQYEFSRLGKLVAATGLIYLLGLQLRGSDWFGNGLASLGLLLGWLLILFLTRFFVADEIRAMSGALQRVLAILGIRTT
jgi:O-antigen/teichoic acid export membrane protein